jgi:hypothetical protein
VNRYLAINVEGKIRQLTVIRTSSFIIYWFIAILSLSRRNAYIIPANMTLLVSLETFFDLTEFSEKEQIKYRVKVMVFKSTFNNISVISWQSVLLVEETGVPGENH